MLSTTEKLITAASPVMLNGIGNVATQPDLADRAVFLTLEPIAEQNVQYETALWARCSMRWLRACSR